MKKSVFLFGACLSVFCTQQAFGKSFCLKEDQLKVQWQAFKTPKKVGVWFDFVDFKLKDNKKANSVQKLLNKQSITIQTGEKSLSSGDPVRDANIVNFFFSKMTQDKVIKGVVKKVSKDNLEILINMNGVEKTVSMPYTLEGSKLVATGKIKNLLDFKLNKAFETLSKACGGLHEGKTWTDVDLKIEADLTCNKSAASKN